MTSYERDHNSPSDRLAAELSTFGGHVVDGLEAIRDLVRSAIEDLGNAVREDLRSQGRRLDRIESQLVTSAELSVTEAERLADLALAMREIGQVPDIRGDVAQPAPDPSATVGAMSDLQARAEALTIAVRDDVLGVFSELQGDLRGFRLQLEGLREEVEALREEFDNGATPASMSADKEAELGRLATEVRLLRRRFQLQAGADGAGQ
jgi:hypothetical protein